MGCTGSRHALRGGVRSPHVWSRSRSGGAHHTVALKSSTLGSLSLERDEEMMKWRDDGGVGAAKTPPPPPKPQLMRRQKQVPGSPVKAPVREPEVINVWELMDGLDDRDEEGDAADAGGEERREKPAPGSPEFDPDVVAAFRKALDEIPPPPDPDGPGDEERIKKPDGPGAGGGDEVGVRKREIQRFPGIVRARVSAFQQRIDAKLAKLAAPAPPPPPDSARKVVVYLTSLRGIRKTYEDCWSTKSVLQSYGVRVDERDLSMHAGFKDELHAALGGSSSSAGRLPQVFADGRHLGGAEEIRRMHEAGELSEALEACEMAPPPSSGGKGVALEACSGCGGVRFVPCEECSGSCKVFLEEAGTFRRCPECNENGLVRCPLCSL